MRKTLIGIASLMLIAAICLANPVRNPTTIDYDGKTAFGNVSVMGNDVDGSPGYIELHGSNADRKTLYYLWVNQEGELMIASDTALIAIGFTGGSGGSQASFPSGDWRTIEDSATKVGSQ